MGNTTRGVPYLDGGTPAAQINEGDQAQAQWINDNLAGFVVVATFAGLPAAAAANDRFIVYAADARAYYRSDGAAWNPLQTIESMTTAQRNGLVAGGKWTGRVIYNTTTGRHEWWNGAAWRTLGGGLTEDTHANRPAADGSQGFYYETDKGGLWADIAGTWFHAASLIDGTARMPDVSSLDVTITYTGTLVTGVTYRDQGGAVRRAADTMAYTGSQLDSVTRRFYAADGVTVWLTCTFAMTYTVGVLTSVDVTVA